MVDATTTGTSVPMADSRFPPTRASALGRLAEFIPRAGLAYAAGRNTDDGPDRPGAVSRLSPYLRYRLVTEPEVVARVLAAHGLEAAGKFVQEVLWRTYWKGWLEMRPGVWSRFLAERDRQREALVDARGIADAERGATGIEGFDDWARELVATGYLHNHARMWFASIWIFTLRLPWALGADFFLRHLLDADAASNTLSWRWVAGLQTAGKTYLATAENIARHTRGRFAPVGLATEAIALREAPLAAAAALPEWPPHDPREPALLLVTPEDLHPESLLARATPFASAIVVADGSLLWGDAARRFAGAAASDTVARTAAQFGCPGELASRLDLEVLVDAARAAGVRRLVSPCAPVGPVADALKRLDAGLACEGITMVQVRRDWDARCWPHALKGYFAFRERMPAVLGELGLA
jgi:deoxyribodipyrimidine photo-lyase